jgi:hypothetical protein
VVREFGHGKYRTITINNNGEQMKHSEYYTDVYEGTDSLPGSEHNDYHGRVVDYLSNDCPALTGYFFGFIEKQIVQAVSSMTPGVPRPIDQMLDIFLWDYFNVEGKKAVLRCVESLINDREVPLVFIQSGHEAPTFMRI